MQLVIAEKPSVAKSIADVLGAIDRQDGYFEGGGYIVSWCVGHLIELAEPESYYGKKAFGSQRQICPKKGKRRYVFVWKKSRIGRKAKMKQLEKEINVTSRKNMMKRYKMYGATVSKLTEKSQNDTKKGEKK